MSPYFLRHKGIDQHRGLQQLGWSDHSWFLHFRFCESRISWSIKMMMLMVMMMKRVMMMMTMMVLTNKLLLMGVIDRRVARRCRTCAPLKSYWWSWWWCSRRRCWRWCCWWWWWWWWGWFCYCNHTFDQHLPRSCFSHRDLAEPTWS